jgi:hypothetical protein
VVRALQILALSLLGACASDGEPQPAKAGPEGEVCREVTCRLERLSRESEGLGDRWLLEESGSFRVFHFASERALAPRLVRHAERSRAHQLRRWQGASPSPWRPRCDVYLYPTTRLLAELGDGSAKAGSASAAPARLTRGQLLSRRLNLAADDRELLENTLPHEISHIIVSELLAPARVPLWAHEGLAMLEEASSAQRSYLTRAAGAADGSAFLPRTLMEATRYPDAPHLHGFYAQSFALTRHLLARGSAAAFIAFLRDHATAGPEAALRRHHGLGLAELQAAWSGILRGGASQ